jgi:YlmC/YmxH family sporulation protein
MEISEMQTKDIIDLDTGDNLGRIIDAEINEKGQIINFTAEPKHFFKRLFKSNQSTILFTNIAKIGSDVILVNIPKSVDVTSEKI